MGRLRTLAVGLAGVLLCSLGAAAQESTLTIAYSASLNGNLDGCNCERGPVAGLVKRAAFLRAWDLADAALLVDAGDLLEGYLDKELSRHILQVYRELGYDAIALGDQELHYGIDRLLAWKRRLPLVCHNLQVPRFGCLVPFSRRPILVERGAARVGIVAVLEPELAARSAGGALAAAEAELLAPGPVADRLSRQLRHRGADVVVLLYHGEKSGAQAVLDRCPEIDVAVFAHAGLLVAAGNPPQPILLSPGPEGNYLGILSLSLENGRIRSFDNEFRRFTYHGDPDDPAVRRRIEDYRRKLRGLLNP